MHDFESTLLAVLIIFRGVNDHYLCVCYYTFNCFGKISRDFCPNLGHEIERTWHFIAQKPPSFSRRFFYCKMCQKIKWDFHGDLRSFLAFSRWNEAEWDKHINNLFVLVSFLGKIGTHFNSQMSCGKNYRPLWSIGAEQSRFFWFWPPLIEKCR